MSAPRAIRPASSSNSTRPAACSIRQRTSSRNFTLRPCRRSFTCHPPARARPAPGCSSPWRRTWRRWRRTPALAPRIRFPSAWVVMKKKMENYASTFIESIADRRHRNVEWARSAVVDSRATTAEKAVDLNVIDLIATDLPDLLQQLDVRTVGDKTLNTAKAEVFEI